MNLRRWYSGCRPLFSPGEHGNLVPEDGTARSGNSFRQKCGTLRSRPAHPAGARKGKARKGKARRGRARQGKHRPFSVVGLSLVSRTSSVYETNSISYGVRRFSHMSLQRHYVHVHINKRWRGTLGRLRQSPNSSSTCSERATLSGDASMYRQKDR